MRCTWIIFVAILFGNHVVGAGAVEYSENVTIDGEVNEDIYITGSITLVNNGTLRRNIYINGPYSLTIENHGIIEGGFITGTGATITQSVSDAGDLHLIPNLSGHTVNVTDAYMLDMADLMAMSGNAAEVQLTDSTIAINQIIPDTGTTIYLNEGVAFSIDGSILSQSSVLLRNIDGSGMPMVTITGVDPMYIAGPADGLHYIIGDELQVALRRQTNYSIVFGGELGDYLDSLRAEHANDKLINRLDRANTRGQLNSVLRKSVRTNPILLAQPMRMVNIMNDISVFNDMDSMATITPFYVASEEFSMYGGNVNVSGRIHDNIFAKFGVFGGMLNYDGKLDNYNSVLYGGNFDVAYNGKDFFADTYGTFSYANFKDINVFNNGHVVKKPSGVAGRFGLDAGKVFNIYDDIKIAPFVGGIIDYAKVLNKNDTDLNLRIGAETMVDTVQDGNKYSVGVRAFIQTDGGIYATLRSNMLSIVDGVGGGINLGVLYSDSVISYKVALDIKFIF